VTVRRSLPLLGTIGLILVLAAACGGASEPKADSTVVEVELANWYVKPDVPAVRAGKVTFRSTHIEEDHSGAHGAGKAGEIHELAVARKNTDGTFEILGVAADIKTGETKSLTLNLKSGVYELQCNVGEVVDGKAVSHYREGMFTSFTVN
jgi:uncharacterized cupredoxin-like copper-binding protein